MFIYYEETQAFLPKFLFFQEVKQSCKATQRTLIVVKTWSRKEMRSLKIRATHVDPWSNFIRPRYCGWRTAKATMKIPHSPTTFLLWDCFLPYFLFIFLLLFFFILLFWINMRVCHIKAVRKCWLSTLVWLQWWKGRDFFPSLFLSCFVIHKIRVGAPAVKL